MNGDEKNVFRWYGIDLFHPVICWWGSVTIYYLSLHNTVRYRYNAVNFLTNIRKGEVWDVFCGSSIWLIFCLSSCNYLCNILYYWPRYNGTRLYTYDIIPYEQLSLTCFMWDYAMNKNWGPCFMWHVGTHKCYKGALGSYALYVYVDQITYSCPNFNSSLPKPLYI